MIYRLIGIILLPIAWQCYRCQVILAPKQLNLDGNDRFLLFMLNSTNSPSGKISAKLTLSFAKNFNHIVHESDIRFESRIDIYNYVPIVIIIIVDK